MLATAVRSLAIIMLLSGLIQLGAVANNEVSATATVYSDWYHGKKTASGERYNKHAMTAASPDLQFGTKVKVTNKRNGRCVIVRINDRQAPGCGKLIDLSKSAAAKLGLNGTARVSIATEAKTIQR